MQHVPKFVEINTEKYNYRGWVLGNKKHGQGRIVYNNSSLQETDRYEGEWQDNQPHGQGCQVLNGIGKYDGNFERGFKSGFGTFKYCGNSEEDIYVGEFKKDHAHGKGYLRWSVTSFAASD